MNYEKEYIDFLIKEHSDNPNIKDFLEKYLYNKIDFSEFIKLIDNNVFDVINWKKFKKDKDIDSLLN